MMLLAAFLLIASAIGNPNPDDNKPATPLPTHPSANPGKHATTPHEPVTHVPAHGPAKSAPKDKVIHLPSHAPAHTPGKPSAHTPGKPSTPGGKVVQLSSNPAPVHGTDSQEDSEKKIDWDNLEEYVSVRRYRIKCKGVIRTANNFNVIKEESKGEGKSNWKFEDHDTESTDLISVCEAPIAVLFGEDILFRCTYVVQKDQRTLHETQDVKPPWFDETLALDDKQKFKIAKYVDDHVSAAILHTLRNLVNRVPSLEEKFESRQTKQIGKTEIDMEEPTAKS